MKKWMTGLAALALATAATIGTMEAPAFASPEVKEGKIDLGGYSLFLDVEGEQKKGQPTIIFESGYGEYSETWHLVQPEVEKFARTVVYDRGALGQSDRSLRPRTAAGIAEDLHELLKKANVKPPYILVGHSIGGRYIRMFQNLYPNEVQGLVVVDGTPDRFLDEKGYIPYTKPEYTSIMKESLDSHPEWANWDDFLTSGEEVYRARPSLKHVPMTVLVAPARVSEKSDDDSKWDATFYLEGFEPFWQERQRELANLSDNSKYVLTEGTGHSIQREQPHYVIDAIKELMERSKK